MRMQEQSQIKKYVVAVSGGVDSVVLLDKLVSAGGHELMVAHFDHGIRPDSAEDVRFVGGLAKKYHLPFAAKREELGESASEEHARRRRYAFLKDVARTHQAKLVTAHHADDVIETIAINIARGTGWRGLAVFSDQEIERPLLAVSKRELLTYAQHHRLEWVEDSTNITDAYFRNRLRQRIARQLPEKNRRLLWELWARQSELAHEIDAETRRLVPSQKEYSRYFFTHIDISTAQELLRAALLQNGTRCTRPQIERALLAIKTAKPGSTHDIGHGATLRFTSRNFIVETPCK